MTHPSSGSTTGSDASGSHSVGKVIVVDKDSFSPEALSAWLDELRMALRLVA